MTDLTDPLTAKVFIVGRNQAKAYDAGRLTHQRHMDALYNRNGESCRGLYAELVGGNSQTRRNIIRLRDLLQRAGVDQVLETNVICYSTAMSVDLALPDHRGGQSKGTDIFRLLLDSIRPPVLIAHGASTIKDLSKIIGYKLPSPSAQPGTPSAIKIENTTILLVRSLAPPEWQKWHTWAWEHLDLVAKKSAELVQSS